MMPDILLSDHANQRLRTAGSNATAADIYTGKIAVVNGVPITGIVSDKKPLTNGNGILLYMQNPLGISDSSFDPKLDHGCLMIRDSNVGTLYGSANWQLQPDGNAYYNAGFAQYVRAIPGAYGVRRKYEVWGRIFNNGIATGDGVVIYSNFVDSNNYWYSQLRRDNSWGGFYTRISEVNAGVFFTRDDDGGYSSALDFPATFHCTLIEQGDALIFQTQLWEDNGTTQAVRTNAYTAVNRPHKSAMEFRITNATTGGNNVQIQGCRVTDML